MKNHIGKILQKKNGYKIIDCKSCKFIHIFPIPSDKKLEKIYKTDYYKDIKPNFIKKHEREIKYWNNIYDEKLDTLDGYIRLKNRKLLDIGSGPGFFLRRAKQHSWNVLGIEPSYIASKYAEKNNIPVIKDLFENVNLQNLGKFNAIYMHDVLEHNKNPIQLIKNCNLLLKKNGIIVIESPNDFNPLQKIVQQKIKKSEYWLAPPFHINYFNFESLCNLLERLGFTIMLKESSFPLELYLLMGMNYLQNSKIGTQVHKSRMEMENNFTKVGQTKLKRSIYQFFASLGIGRTLIIYAKKNVD